MIKSSLLNYELPNSSINQEPYENPLDSKLLIAKNREIISFKQFPEYVESDSLFIFNKSTVRKVRILTEKNTGGSLEIFITKKLNDFEAICLLKSSDKKSKNKKYQTNLFNFELELFKGFGFPNVSGTYKLTNAFPLFFFFCSCILAKNINIYSLEQFNLNNFILLITYGKVKDYLSSEHSNFL